MDWASVCKQAAEELQERIARNKIYDAQRAAESKIWNDERNADKERRARATKNWLKDIRSHQKQQWKELRYTLFFEIDEYVGYGGDQLSQLYKNDKENHKETMMVKRTAPK